MAKTRLVEVHPLLDCAHVLANLQLKAQLDGDEQTPKVVIGLGV